MTEPRLHVLVRRADPARCGSEFVMTVGYDRDFNADIYNVNGFRIIDAGDGVIVETDAYGVIAVDAVFAGVVGKDFASREERIGKTSVSAVRYWATEPRANERGAVE